MAMSFEMQVHSDLHAGHVFSTIADLRSWDTYAGVLVRGPERLVSTGDRVEISVKVMRREIQSGCLIRSVDEPLRAKPGRVDIVSVDGPFDSRMIGSVTPTKSGCDLMVEVYGIGRGAARMLERPL